MKFVISFRLFLEGSWMATVRLWAKARRLSVLLLLEMAAGVAAQVCSSAESYLRQKRCSLVSFSLECEDLKGYSRV
jgi:hypothetical protein